MSIVTELATGISTSSRAAVPCGQLSERGLLEEYLFRVAQRLDASWILPSGRAERDDALEAAVPEFLRFFWAEMYGFATPCPIQPLRLTGVSKDSMIVACLEQAKRMLQDAESGQQQERTEYFTGKIHALRDMLKGLRNLAAYVESPPP